MKGIVIETSGSWYEIKREDGNIVTARLKGKHRLSELKLTNPIAVGDHVVLSNVEEDDSIMIDEILPRKNQIIRQSPRKRRHYHIIAANIDQALLIASIAKPKTKPGFLSRVLVALEYYHITPIVVFNKADIYKAKDVKKYEQLKADIEQIGYQTLLISAEEQTGLDKVVELTANKLSVVTGPSGVGKSTLINCLNSELQLRTKAISNYKEKGQHTTTSTRMHPLNNNGFIIDTPGIKEYGLAEIDAYELGFYFPEIERVQEHCKFSNCQHINEPKCAVLEAVSEGEIAEWRYNSYLQIREELLIENKHYL